MRAIFHGYYGARNSGDDAFCDVAAWGARKYWGAHSPLFFSETLPRMSVNARCYSPHRSYPAFARGVFDILRSDAFVSAGGSTYHSALKMSDFRSYAGLKKKLRLPGVTAALGISLGPYRNAEAEKSTISYLRTLDYLALRDSRSYELAKSYNLARQPVLAFDLAALLPDMYGKQNTLGATKRNVVGVSVCNYERYVGGDTEKERLRMIFLQELVALVGQSMDVHFRFFVFNGHPDNGDEEATAMLVSALPSRATFDIVPYSGDVERTFGLINECDIVVAVRLHAAVFACFGGTPFFLVEYHQKCSDFLDDVGQAGANRVGDGSRSVREVRDRLAQVLEGAVIPPSKVAEMSERALRNFLWS